MQMDFTLFEALTLGITAQMSGRFDDAKKYYQSILLVHPENVDANFNLAEIFYSEYNLVDSLEYYKRAVASGKNALYARTLISRQIDLKLFKEAQVYFEQTYQLLDASTVPEFERAIQAGLQGSQNRILTRLSEEKAIKLARDCAKRKDYFNASQIYREILYDMPTCSKAKWDIKKLFKQKIKVDIEEPINSERIRIKSLYDQKKYTVVLEQSCRLLLDFPRSEFLFNICGSANAELGRFDAACGWYDQLKSFSSDYRVRSNLGFSLMRRGFLDSAIKEFEHALNDNPSDVYSLGNIGLCHCDLEQFETASNYIEKALAIEPDNFECLINRGTIYYRKNQSNEAIETFEAAARINPNSARPYVNLGVVHSHLGDSMNAKMNFRRALEINPEDMHAVTFLTGVTKYNSLADNHILKLKELLNRKDISQDARCNLHFCLGKVHDDLKDYETAYQHYYEANSLRKTLLNYTFKHDEKLFNRLRSTQKAFHNHTIISKSSDKGPKPIFIVGMPRSGTTLLEQMISNHSMVEAAGELKKVQELGRLMLLDPKNISKHTMLKFSNEYVHALQAYAKGKPFVTDKMPQNFLYIPMILSAMPFAKIIHIQRDPGATCWSAYTQNFVDKIGYSTDLDAAAKYYQSYREMMALWNSIYPESILNIKYEDLIGSAKETTTQTLQYLGLPWEEDCLFPERNTGLVKTASAQQVRKSIYTGSSQKWHAYKSFIGNTFDCLYEPSESACANNFAAE
jgi:tetratricopeptide (TPR) repeat protein